MKMSTRIFSAILCLLMLAYVIPAGTFAVKAASSIKIANVTLESGKYLAVGSSSATSTKPSSKYAYYKDGVLELNDFTFSGTGYGINSSEALTVNIVGTNSFTTGGYHALWCDSSLTLKGTGKLTLQSSTATAIRSNLALNILGGVITASSESAGAVYAATTLTASGGTLLASTSSTSSIIINVGTSMTVNGGRIQATTSSNTSGISIGSALTVSKGDLFVSSYKNALTVGATATISGGTVTIEGKGTTSTPAFNIKDKLTVSGGTIKSTSEGSAAVKVMKNGIDMTGGYIVTTSKSNGIYVEDGDFNLKNGTVRCESGALGIYVFIGSLNVSGSAVIEIESADDSIFASKFLVENAEYIRLVATDSTAQAVSLSSGLSSSFSIPSNLAVSASNNSNGSNPVIPTFSGLKSYKYFYARVPDVYVGGVGMACEDYLAEGATVASTYYPGGDYAHVTLNGEVIELSLDNFDITTTGSVAGINSPQRIQIRLYGKNTITTEKGAGVTADGTILFAGDGYLDIKSTKGSGIKSTNGDIYFLNGNITIDTYDNGIYAPYDKDIEVKAGTISVISSAHGIFGNSLIVSNASVSSLSKGTSSFLALRLTTGLTTSLQVTASTAQYGTLTTFDSAKLDSYKVVKIAAHACNTKYHIQKNNKVIYL